MDNYIINTGTITYALRGRDALRKYGINAYMFRSTGNSAVGCGYSISAKGNKNEIISVLRTAGVKYVNIEQGDGV